ncbi:MAG: WhiB family transcriptional regulator [Candidatus Methylomirabilales bacterium]
MERNALPATLTRPPNGVEGSPGLAVPGAGWQAEALCNGQTDLFFAPSGERPEARARREAKARQVCIVCPVLDVCRAWARQHREYGFWGGESEEDRAQAGYRVDMPVGRVARYSREGRVIRSA